MRFGIFRRKPLMGILASNQYPRIDEGIIDPIFVDQLHELMSKSERVHREVGSVILIQRGHLRVYRKSTMGRGDFVDLSRVFVKLSIDEIKRMVGIVHTHTQRYEVVTSHLPSAMDIVSGTTVGFILGRDEYINMVLYRLKKSTTTIMPAYECIGTLYNMSPNVDRLKEVIDELYFYIKGEVESYGEEYTREEFFLDYYTGKYPEEINIEKVQSMKSRIDELYQICREDVEEFMRRHERHYGDFWWEGLRDYLEVKFVILEFHEYKVLDKYEVYNYNEVWYG